MFGKKSVFVVAALTLHSKANSVNQGGQSRCRSPRGWKRQHSQPLPSRRASAASAGRLACAPGKAGAATGVQLETDLIKWFLFEQVCTFRPLRFGSFHASQQGAAAARNGPVQQVINSHACTLPHTGIYQHVLEWKISSWDIPVSTDINRFGTYCVTV